MRGVAAGREKGKVGVTSLGRRPSTRKPVRGFTYSIAGFAALSSCSGDAPQRLQARKVFVGFPEFLVGLDPTTPARAFFWSSQVGLSQLGLSSQPGPETITGSTCTSSSIFFYKIQIDGWHTDGRSI